MSSITIKSTKITKPWTIKTTKIKQQKTGKITTIKIQIDTSTIIRAATATTLTTTTTNIMESSHYLDTDLCEDN